MQHEIVIEGRPVPKDRPRFNRKTGHTYTPKKTQDAEKAIAAAWAESDPPSFDGPVRVEFDFRPNHTLIRVVDFNVGIPTLLRGDIDNYVKTALDGLQKGGAFKNDKQVVSLEADKF